MSSIPTLDLSFKAAPPGAKGGAADPVAKIFVDTACSYLKENGAAVLSIECKSVEALEQESQRLKEELDEIVSRARDLFAGHEPVPAESPQLHDEAPPQPKRVLGLCDDFRVRDRMSSPVKTVRRNDRLCIADELMKVGSFRHIVVLEDESDDIVGVLSQRDIYFSALAWATGQGKTAHERSLETISIKDVMQTSTSTVGPDEPLADAAATMIEHKIGCLPVIDDGALIGILTEGDFLVMLSEASYSGGGQLEK